MIVLVAMTYNGAPTELVEARFDELGGTIGRADGNQMVLPDPERTISRVHAKVVFRNGGYAIEDRGSNPISVNGNVVGHGSAWPLAPGDVVQIGGYELCVRASGAPVAAADPINDVFATPPRPIAEALPSSPTPMTHPTPTANAIPVDWDSLAEDIRAGQSDPLELHPNTGNPVGPSAAEESIDDLFGLGDTHAKTSKVWPADDDLLGTFNPTGKALDGVGEPATRRRVEEAPFEHQPPDPEHAFPNTMPPPAARPTAPQPAAPSHSHVLTEGEPAGSDPIDAPDNEHTETFRPVGRKPDNVQFRAYAPQHFVPGTVGLVDIWACLPTQADDVAALAASTAQTLQVGLRTGVALERGVTISVRMKAEGLQVHAGAQTMLWAGEPCNVTFQVLSPSGQAHGAYPARARLLADGVTVGEVRFLLHVRARAPEGMRTDVASTVHYVRSAFASYASTDRPEMLARIQGMKKIAPDLDVFIDALNLRSGQRWQQRIEEEVQRRERLFLFWSRQASGSQWVDFEWRLAHRLKGLDAIDPVPLDDPSAAPPPRELSALHFGDAYVAYIQHAR